MRLCNARKCMLRELLNFLLGWGFSLEFRVYVLLSQVWMKRQGLDNSEINKEQHEVSTAKSQSHLWFTWSSRKLLGKEISQGNWQHTDMCMHSTDLCWPTSMYEWVHMFTTWEYSHILPLFISWWGKYVKNTWFPNGLARK